MIFENPDLAKAVDPLDMAVDLSLLCDAGCGRTGTVKGLNGEAYCALCAVIKARETLGLAGVPNRKQRRDEERRLKRRADGGAYGQRKKKPKKNGKSY